MVMRANLDSPMGEQNKDSSSSFEIIVPTLQNMVSTVNLDCKLNLKDIVLHARNAEYNPKPFAAVIMRIREPKTTALILLLANWFVLELRARISQK